MQFGICSEIFQGWKLDEAMRFAAQTGYDVIEIAPFTLAKYVTELSASDRQRIREDAQKTGIKISGIHWVLAHTEGLHVNHPDAEIRSRTARYFCDLVDFCADIGGQSMVIGSPKQRQILDGVTPQQAWAWARETFRDAVKRAESRAVTLCFEPLAPSETNFINTAAEAIRFVKEIPSPNFKIILDVKAMSSETKTIPEIIRESANQFGYFHANDRNLKGPGFGDVDFVPIASALREVDYQGVVSVEVFSFEEGPEVIAKQSLAYLHKCFRRS
ncbi:MAG: sugar phosphate isomerase/epimerase [Verrucomicrobiales bacterium]|nr:sugar phosphate isomerase/epimerase [Verrucomicrobiales bacterium]